MATGKGDNPGVWKLGTGWYACHCLHDHRCYCQAEAILASCRVNNVHCVIVWTPTCIPAEVALCGWGDIKIQERTNPSWFLPSVFAWRHRGLLSMDYAPFQCCWQFGAFCLVLVLSPLLELTFRECCCAMVLGLCELYSADPLPFLRILDLVPVLHCTVWRGL